MSDAVIVGAVRTPVGRRKGSLTTVHPVDLSAHVLRALAERTGIDPAQVDDVVWGCVSQVGDQSWNVARNGVLAAGWPESVPGTTLDRQCGSSQQALHFAAATVLSGQADLVVAGGVESMTRVAMGSSVAGGSPFSDQLRDRYRGVEGFADDAPLPFNQGVGAELIAERWRFSRAQLDEFALASHDKAAAAQDAGAFEAEIAPVALADGGKFTADEGIRRDTSLAKLGELATPFRPDGVVTAGSASQISDGAAALAVTTSEWASRHGLRPLARVHTAVVAADDPVTMLTAPIPATAKALRRAGLGIEEIGVYEVNEAFAPVPLAWLAETEADPARLNPRGGAIALGHPLGGSGARIMTTMLAHMRDNDIRYGLQTMCEGGGMANATIVELL
ncbi:acetyl-CoA C-acyltransferase [Micromonospora peucetia]|uniref:Acetyl-CoA C-acyltransferase n=1 Tax=Micromonospora peucetia TaxID=47871 RepID=A0A1C6UYW6_9ACTN|nr:acetyl-CoA C-acyltransferase [Micromonospora peucetia]MCX4387766.1 acetyl-CoA C-acyltransferase [Micromonospora peucetia]WSA35078.1 acetyl-CoA C-acyltransferase [Micromonospora peucetia]SCL59265.1 acetyl-CoA acyltransferase [Micromonospora peucetia]